MLSLPFQRLCRCVASFVPLSAPHHHNFKTQARAVILSLISFRAYTSFTQSFLPLRPPPKKHLRGKKLRHPCVFKRSAPEPSITLRNNLSSSSGFFCATPSFRSRRLAPLTAAGRSVSPLRYANCPPASVRLKAV